MKTKLLALAVGFLAAATTTLAQPCAPPSTGNRMGHFPTVPRELRLTDQQRSQVQKIRFDLTQKQIDIRAQLAHDRVDYAELAAANAPDEGAMDAKVQDIAKLKGELHSNMLGAWFEVNKVLTPEQQKIWKKVLEHPMLFSRMARMRRMMDHRGRFMIMRKGMMMGRGGMMGGNGPMGRQMWNRNQNPPDSSQ